MYLFTEHGKGSYAPSKQKHSVPAVKLEGLSGPSISLVLSLPVPQNHTGNFSSNADVQAVLLEILFQGKQEEAQASEF